MNNNNNNNNQQKKQISVSKTIPSFLSKGKSFLVTSSPTIPSRFLNQSSSAAESCREKKPIKMMPLSSSRCLSFTIFLVLLTSSCSSSCYCSDHRGVVLDHARRSIYDVLQSNGLPIGILPEGISDFKVDEGGNFEVHLEEACNAKFETQVRYEKNISGVLSFGQIVGLSGISAQELFLWFPVKVIRVDIPSSGLIYFDVGVIYKQFSLSLFETPPECTAAQNIINQVSQYEQLHEGKEMVDVVFKNDKEKFQDYAE